MYTVKISNKSINSKMKVKDALCVDVEREGWDSNSVANNIFSFHVVSL